MKHLLTTLLIMAVLTWVGSSCHRAVVAEPHKWTRVDAEFDSLSSKAETYLFDMTAMDSLDALIVKMTDAALRQKGRKSLDAKVQVAYWMTYFKFCVDRNPEASKLLAGGKLMADSANDDYARHRFADLENLFLHPKDYMTLQNLLEDMDYYAKIGDLGQQGNMAMFISNNLLYPPVPELSLRYLDKADSLFALAGLEGRREGMLINRFTLLGQLGRLDEAQVVYDKLLADAVADDDTVRLEMLMRNHHFFYDDSASLFGGYNLVKSIVAPDSVAKGVAAIRGLYEGLISAYCLENNDLGGGGASMRVCASSTLASVSIWMLS